MDTSDHQWAFLQDVAKLVGFAVQFGYKLTGGDLWRADWVQDTLYQKGISPTRNSNHELRLAIDLNLFIDDDYQQDTKAYWELGKFWKNLSPYNRWGGDFQAKDGNHFERNLTSRA